MKKGFLSMFLACVFVLAGTCVQAQSRFTPPYDFVGEYQSPDGVKLSWSSEAPVSSVPEDLYWDLETMIEDWTVIDADGDTHIWMHVQGLECSSGYVCLVSESKDCYGTFGGIPYTPDNYIVTPRIQILPGTTVSFMACSADATAYMEHFGVAVSTTDNTNAADFTTIAEWTITPNKLNQTPWAEYGVDLSEYAGQEVYIGFRHFDCTNQYALAIDDIRVTYNAEPNGLESFNLYRSGDDVDYQLIASVPAVEGQTHYEYLDEEVEERDYYYQVTAVYAGQGETEPASTEVSVTSVTENAINAKVYPNPTNGLLKLEAAGMKQITVMNALGQVVYSAVAEGGNAVVDLSAMESGMYLLRIEAESGSEVRQISVVR